MVPFYPWFKFNFPLFQTHYHTLQYPKTKENKIWTKDKIESQHIRSALLYIKFITICVFLTYDNYSWFQNCIELITFWNPFSGGSYVCMYCDGFLQDGWAAWFKLFCHWQALCMSYIQKFNFINFKPFMFNEYFVSLNLWRWLR